MYYTAKIIAIPFFASLSQSFASPLYLLWEPFANPQPRSFFPKSQIPYPFAIIMDDDSEMSNNKRTAIGKQVKKEAYQSKAYQLIAVTSFGSNGKEYSPLKQKASRSHEMLLPIQIVYCITQLLPPLLLLPGSCASSCPQYLLLKLSWTKGNQSSFPATLDSPRHCRSF